jgi:hypothetical protein
VAEQDVGVMIVMDNEHAIPRVNAILERDTGTPIVVRTCEQGANAILSRSGRVAAERLCALPTAVGW